MPQPTVYLKEYQAPAFAVTQVNLEFELYEDHAMVTAVMSMKRIKPGPLHLYGDELELISIRLGEQVLDDTAYQRQANDLIITACSDAFSLQIVTRIYPQDNTQLSGLYHANGLFCTQCEAEGFRRITFFLDRPDVLTTYTTRISADKAKYPVLLANGNLIDAGEDNDGRHWVIWQDPFNKPSYLFALVAGNLACVADQFMTCSGKMVDLRIYVEPGNEDKCAHAMASLKKAMRWDEEVYGREYDLSIFMIVAVSSFNMGAMENKGLNIFNAKYILASPDTATDQDFADIEGVVAHEYFHNWTGNRVTCRDWFQLSLKEGLTVFRDQEFSRDMNSRDVNRILDVKLLRSSQFPEDASSMAHPVRPQSYQEINNFYTATIYNKGAEVIRMQHTLLGQEGFRRGMDLYFQRHDGQAVTIDDFVAAMADANQVDLTQFMRWYDQAGTPEVQVDSVYQAHTLTLTLSQTCPPTPECQHKKPFHIPIRFALFDESGKRIPLAKEVLELTASQQQFSFSQLPGKPIVSLLRDFSAPIKLIRDFSQEDLLALLRFETDGYVKWDAAQRLALNCITRCFTLPQANWQIPTVLSAAFHHVLVDESLDEALRAVILTPPGFEEIAASLSSIEVNALEMARGFYRQALGTALLTQAHNLYLNLWQREEHAMHAHAYGQRGIRNLCLALMMYAKEEQALTLCQQQFSQARTMTDQLASFALLNNCQDEQIRQDSRAAFYKQWANNELVIDKWFAIQASCELPHTLTQVKSLMQHPAFNIKNPNKVRALIGTFCQSNPRHFHAIDGSGYAFLADTLVQLDPINPQIAARLATPFTRWQRFDGNRQALMKQQLTQLAALKLSRDLTEVVTKSLAVL